MNFNQFVFRNTIRNKHLYLAYFLSTTVSVMVFFAFTALANHPAIVNGSLDKRADMGMLTAAIIIYLFAFLFVFYSMDVFIQSRKKEFGLMMIQGMSPKQLKNMIFIENLVIGFFATIFGSLIGIGFTQLIILLANKMMHLDFSLYFPTQSILITVAAFALLFVVISFLIRTRLPKMSVQELLQAGDLGKGVIKFSKIKAILGLLLIGIGYAVALLVPGVGVIMATLPVVAVVIVGTSLFFNQASVMIIEGLKKNTKLFWKKTNMIVFSDLSFRMKDNARSFILVAVISTVAFAAIGTLYGVEKILLGAIEEQPYELEVMDKAPVVQKQAEKIDTLLSEKKITADKVETTIYSMDDKQFLTETDYNKLATLLDEETISVKQAVSLTPASQQAQMDAQTTTAKTVTIGTQKLQVERKEKTNLVATYLPTYVVPDGTNFSKMEETKRIVWQPKNTSREALIKFGEALTKESETYVMAKTYIVQTVIDSYAPILFVGVFIGVIFFISAGSFLYFRLYSDLAKDTEKFAMIYKIGLTKKELKKMISQQVGILFFTPIIVSVIHGGVALTAMYHIFNMGMQKEGLMVLGLFIVIQLIYYLFARHFYFKKVYASVQH
ncbi:ABC transporter permease [Enterococcus massiliensis]|uniref:ABC transporter permease n=1 Tax=Enterococcus massiliensis TaxID=1640685 RepID=UPI00065DE5A9|nr:ABC transporter permease [Enterococcus massiliensis]